MDRAVKIRSAHDGTTLAFFDYHGDSYKVTLRGPNCEATASVYAYQPYGLSFVSFFQGLAHDWSGWKGEKKWLSLEGELELSATIDLTGHVNLKVRIKSDPYPYYGWSFSTTLLLEAGQLEQIARQIESFTPRST
jgi:hypothetical protein